MNIQSILDRIDRIKERALGTKAPKKPRKPRQPKDSAPREPLYNEKHVMQCFKEIRLTLVNHHARIHELEQIEHRRSEREKEMKTNG